jgi:signal peptidase I
MNDTTTSPEGTVEKAETKSKTRKVKTKPVWREYLEAIVVAVALALFIRTFAFQAFRIPSGSMEDTLLVGDYLFVNKFLYGARIPFTHTHLPAIRSPHRGDIIVFQYPLDPSEDYIKRCVGLPGDTIEVRDHVLYVNGDAQDEPYTKHVNHYGNSPRSNFGPVTVPEGEYFMMGDNRDNSSDSRVWGFLDRSLIRGKALFIYFSWDSVHTGIRFSRIFDIIH